MAWRAICDRCGFERSSDDLRREWTGLRVCRDTCWEARNQQEFVRGVPDKQNPPWVRPEPEPVFIDAINDNLLLMGLREDGFWEHLEGKMEDGSYTSLEGTR